MNREIKFELLRLFRGRLLWICAGILVLLSFFTAAIAGKNLAIADETAYVLANSGIDILLAVTVPVFICDDFKNGILRLMVGRGVSRLTILIGKCIQALVQAAIFLVISAIIGIIYGKINHLDSGNILGLLRGLPLVYLVLLTFAFMIILLSYLFKNKAVTIAVGILATNIVELALTLIEKFIMKNKISLSDYWIPTLFQNAANTGISSTEIVKIIVMSLIYIAVFLGIAAFVANRSEA